MDASAFRNKTNLTQRNRRALPFVAAEDGSPPGEAVDFNPNSAVMACRSAFPQSRSASAAWEIRGPAISETPM
jgi:hypothetical protein